MRAKPPAPGDASRYSASVFAGIIETGDGATGRRHTHEAFWDLAFNAMLASGHSRSKSDKAGERPAATTVTGESR